MDGIEKISAFVRQRNKGAALGVGAQALRCFGAAHGEDLLNAVHMLDMPAELQPERPR